MEAVNPSPEIPDHALLRRVGRGSYGEVWLARNLTGSFRAVKVVYRASFESERPYEREFGGLQRFEPVSRTHPGLVSILHVGRNDAAGYFYCIMEAADDLASGQAIDPEKYQPHTLAAEVAARGRLPVEQCAGLGCQLAAGLEHLHASDLVHRDIKPSNIIFVSKQPKFADIGLVTRIGARASFVGTEGYLAPEGPGSPAADLYSLGKVLYEISFGKPLDQFPELPTHLREWPEAGRLMQLNEIVLRACANRPADRFRSAGELRSALVRLCPPAAGGPPDQPTTPGAGRTALILSFGGSPAETELARRLSDGLMTMGFVVLANAGNELSVAWARQLEQQIGSAQVVVAVLAAASTQSELMAYALELVSQAAGRGGQVQQVVALRTEGVERLPRQFAIALEKTTTATDVEEVLAKLRSATKPTKSLSFEGTGS